MRYIEYDFLKGLKIKFFKHSKDDILCSPRSQDSRDFPGDYFSERNYDNIFRDLEKSGKYLEEHLKYTKQV